MTESKATTRMPTPLYAAAGIGDLAYRKLRELPGLVTELSDKAITTSNELRERAAELRAADRDELRDRAGRTTAELRERTTATLRAANTSAANLRARAATFDLDRLRGIALRNAAAALAGAQAAQDRAIATYDALVARGERVIGSGLVQVADTVNADMEATSEGGKPASEPVTRPPR